MIIVIHDMIQTTDYQCFVEVYEWVLKCNINNSLYDTDYRLLMLCGGVRVAIGMYASAGMRTHAFSLFQGKVNSSM